MKVGPALAAALAALAAPLAAQAESPSGQAAAADAVCERLILTRTVVRTLHDDKRVVARRRYAICIAAQGEGYVVTGALTESTVDAPAQLAALAALERDRPDTGLFPLRLDRQRRIVAAGPAQEAGQRAAGRAAALALVGTAALPQGDAAAAGGFISRIAAEGVTTAWPDLLFQPDGGDSRDVQHLTLGNGQAGQAVTTVRIVHRLSSGAPALVERLVATEIGGTQRITREEWQIEPAPGG